jgi:4-aminobutyrate aminotransferase/(S)-3-amino-2-methylpropionate transaminase
MMTRKNIVNIKGTIPGPHSLELYNIIEENVPRGLYHLKPVAISSAKGATITDVDGNVYLDFTSGLGGLSVGHRAPEVVEAIKKQADKYLHVSFGNLLYEPYANLAAKLNQITPGKFSKKTMLTNSGAEAVENAIRISKLHTKRYATLSFMCGFHGRTALTSTLTGQVMPYKYNMGPGATGVYHLPPSYCYRCYFGLTYPNCEIRCARFIERIFESVVQPDNVAALIFEPILGDGGVIILLEEFLDEICRICKKNGITLIGDEIISGFARTGKMFAVEYSGVEPDILITGKSLGGGMLLSAITGRSDVMDAPHVGGLGGTYAGHPISCQAALASINIIERDKLVDKANHIDNRLKEGFREMADKYPIIGDIRGLGAFLGVELVKDRINKEPATQETTLIRSKCYENGLITGGGGVYRNIVRLLVPLVTSDDEIDEGLSIIDDVIGKISSK